MATGSIAKLSAGTRVLTAKDDAASLAIGSGLAAEIAGQQQAQVNATQATSMLQVADGAMSTVNDILVRMKTLSVQAGSGQLGATERGDLDTEYQGLLSEVDRIAQSTSFNGVKLVNGSSPTSTTLNHLSSGNVVDAAHGFQSIALGNGVGNATIKTSYDSSTHVMTLTNLTSGVSQGIDIGSTAIASGGTQTVSFSTVGATITLNSAFSKSTSIPPANSFALETFFGQSGALANIKIASANQAAYNLLKAATSTDGVIIVNPNTSAVVSFAGMSTITNLSGTGSNSVTLSGAGGASMTVTFDITTGLSSGAGIHTLSLNEIGSYVYGSTATSNASNFSFKLGTGTTAGVDDVSISVSAVSSSALGLTGTSLTGSDATNANTASTAITAAINTLNTARAGIGASQNRLQFASNNLTTSVQNTESARSSLMDLDMASEMTKFTNAQVLEQAGISMLAQANQMPQHLLKLFQ